MGERRRREGGSCPPFKMHYPRGRDSSGAPSDSQGVSIRETAPGVNEKMSRLDFNASDAAPDHQKKLSATGGKCRRQLLVPREPENY